MTLELLNQKREDILRIASHHGVSHIRVFGSVVRGEADSNSDIDFLVKKESRTSSWFPAGLVLELEELLGCRVEIVTETGLNHYLRDRVLQEAIPL